MNKRDKKKVLVAMSGGVDSSVAAALLKKQGHKVAGAFMHFWSESNKPAQRGSENKCCSAEAETIARQVAAKLNIPFYVFHFEDEFKKAVVDYFLDEFRLGRTPNPCVACNKEIKFGLMFEKALGLGFDFVATGHYARLRQAEACRRREFPIFNFLGLASARPRAGQFPNCRLLKAKDKTKDQSYFLWTLGQKQISRLIFPVGDYKKQEVYKLAKEWNLPYRQAESFDICFIAGKDHKDFLKRYLQPKVGPIVDTASRVVGQHDGLSLFTIGQRKDIGVGATGPYYVVGGDFKTNILFVTNKPYDRRLYKKSLIAEKVSWVSDQAPKLPLKCQAKIRYGHPAVPAVIKSQRVRESKSQRVLVEFKNSQRAVTPGQSVVFYQGQEVLGGGVIKKDPELH